MRKITQFSVSSLLIIGLLGCQADSNVSNIVTVESYTKNVPVANVHGKQGAAVSLVNSKVNLSSAGVQHAIEIGINSRYNSGIVHITVSSSDGLHIVSGDTSIEQSLTEGEMTFPFEVNAEEDGRYYLRAVVRVEVNGVKSARALSMIVQVGEQDKSIDSQITTQSKSVLGQSDKNDKVYGEPVLLLELENE